MKFPWSSSENSAKKNNELIKESKEKETNKTYELSSLPEDLQKIAILIQQTDKEISYLKKKLEVTSIAKTELDQKLFRGIKALNL